MKISKALRGNLDLQQIECLNVAAASAGSGSDFEHVIGYVADLTQGGPSGAAGMQAVNYQQIRYFTMVWEATMTGQATNYFTINFNQYRAGALLVNTTSSTSVSAAGSATITVGSGGAKNCYIGQYLNISGGTGTAETVQVTAFNANSNTITAVFANTHSGTYNVVAAPLATLAYSSSSVTDSKFVPHQIKALPNTVQAGDVITVARVSTGTGLASVAATFGYEWVCAGPQ
jgi:hypothetical protein